MQTREINGTGAMRQTMDKATETMTAAEGGEGEVVDATIELDVELEEATIEEGESSRVMIEVEGEAVVVIEEDVELGVVIGEPEVPIVTIEEGNFLVEKTMEAEAEDTTTGVDEMTIEEPEVVDVVK